MINKWYAAIISFVVGGLGQIIQGQTLKGIILLIIWIILQSLYYVQYSFSRTIYYVILVTAFSLIVAYDAYRISY